MSSYSNCTTSFERTRAALLRVLVFSGCLDPSRLNARCEWLGDTLGAPLDLAVGKDRRHLAYDVRDAGENAVRYRDMVHQRSGFAAAGNLDVECLDRLYPAIEGQHGVRRADIERVATMRDAPLDFALVYIPVGLLFLLVSSRICRRNLGRMPPPGERWTSLLEVAWTGLIVSAFATGIAQLHSWNVDTIRLRDFHLSFRASYLPIGRHPWLSYFVALTCFAAVSLREYRRAGISGRG